MATRDDIAVVQDTDPRYAEIAAPSTEIVMQDYVDTLREIEDDFQNMGFPSLIQASGKEDLGGGTLVAITVEEQNLQLAFQPRTTPAVTGTVTTASGPPSLLNRISFVDTGADFVTAGVIPGSYIVNWTDRSVSDVVRVINSTTLELRTPDQGTDNEYDLNDEYSLWNITQVRTSGGNLVAVDELDASISAILPTWGTQVILTTSSSATIQELEDIQQSSFNNQVQFDPQNTSGNAMTGTAFPAGTGRSPCLLLSDALLIAADRGFDEILVRGTYTFQNTDVVSDLIFQGVSTGKSGMVLTAAASISNCVFRDLTLSGNLDGGNDASFCIMSNINFIDGNLLDCLLVGTITVSGTQANFLRCASGVAGGGPGLTVVIDCDGGGTDILVRDYQGGISFINNSTPGDNISIDMSSGRVTFDGTITENTWYVRGIAEIQGSVAGNASINTDGLLNQTTIAGGVWNALLATYNATGSFGQHVGRKLLTVARFFGLR